MRRSRLVFVAALCGIALASKAQSLPTFASWDVREVEHPVLGAIKVAVPQSGITTQVKGARIVSAAFVSCEKASGTIAIELANSIESDTQGGLRPAQLPRMVCNGRASGAPARTTIRAKWSTNELGDVMARGLPAAELRRCGAIDIEQDVALPPSLALASQRIALRLLPATTDLANVLACDEATRTSEAAVIPPATEPKPAPAPESKPAPAPEPKPPQVLRAAAVVDSPWKRAHTVAGSRTNVRAAPRIDGRLVKQLDAGTRVLVQKAEGDWWRVKPSKGTGPGGYIRADRLAFE